MLAILLAILIFDLRITTINSLGILSTLIGGTWFATVAYQEKQRKGNYSSTSEDEGGEMVHKAGRSILRPK